MPRYVFRCPKGHTTEEQLSFAEFVRVRICTALIPSPFEDVVPGVQALCSHVAELQIQPTPFVMAEPRHWTPDQWQREDRGEHQREI